jgi:hypothetical protein
MEARVKPSVVVGTRNKHAPENITAFLLHSCIPAFLHSCILNYYMISLRKISQILFTDIDVDEFNFYRDQRFIKIP